MAENTAGSENNIPFRGILAIGNTKTQAINRYRLLALGKGVSMYTDESQSSAFISNSASGSLAELFNPQTGDMDIVQADALLPDLQFDSKSSNVEVNYYKCTSGCGAHLVYDDEALVHFCPVCASEVEEAPEEDEDQGEFEDEASDDAECSDDDVVDEDEEDEGDDLDLDSESGDDDEELDDEEEDEDLESESGDDESLDDLDDEDEDDEDDEDEDEDEGEDEDEDEGEEEADEDDADADADEPLVVAADSLAEAQSIYAREKAKGTSLSGNVEVNYYECTSGCGAHILSDEELEECPACSSELEEEVVDKEEEPIVVAGSTLEEASTMYAKEKAGQSLSSDNFDVNYYVCTNSSCKAHVIADEDQTECPVCESALREPKNSALSSGELFSYSCDEALADDDEDLDTDIGDEDEDDVDADADESESGDGDDDEDDIDDEIEDDDGEESDSSDYDFDEVSLSDDDVDDEIEDDDTTDVEVNPMDDVDEEADASDLEVAFCSALKAGARWLAIYKGQPIASLSREQSGKNKDIFDQASFGTAVITSAKHAGVRQTLDELGFKPFTRTISVSAIVDQLAAEKIEEVQTEAQEEQEQYAEALQAAMATAAVGLNRGFFVNMKNPLKDAFYSALSTAGIKNPDSIIANVFRDHADGYHKVLFAKANEILQKPVEVRESLAKTVLETNYSESVSNNGVNAVDERLGNLGNVVADHATPVIPAKQEALSSDYSDSVAKVVTGLGRRR